MKRNKNVGYRTHYDSDTTTYYFGDVAICHNDEDDCWEKNAYETSFVKDENNHYNGKKHSKRRAPKMPSYEMCIPSYIEFNHSNKGKKSKCMEYVKENVGKAEMYNLAQEVPSRPHYNKRVNKSYGSFEMKEEVPTQSNMYTYAIHSFYTSERNNKPYNNFEIEEEVSNYTVKKRWYDWLKQLFKK